MRVSEDEARAVETQITYLQPESFINRRFVAPGVERNTGKYQPHRVMVRDGRPLAAHFTLDTHGFTLSRQPSAVKDFFDREDVEAVYPAEVAQAVKALTGADRVATLGWMVRTVNDIPKAQRVAGYSHKSGVQPPAGEAHVDTMPERAYPMAKNYHETFFPDAGGYSRFVYSSFWRTFSEPPQDTPLAFCDFRSVGADEGVPNTLHVVDQIPDEAEMLDDKWNGAPIAAAIFHHNPAHRWWYFSNMTRDEAVLLKFHDSDQGRAWRVPHTAFRDPSFPNAKPRSSIEFRTIAYFD